MKEQWLRTWIRLLAKRTDVAKLIHELAADGGIDLYPLAYYQNGIMKYKNCQESGEHHLLSLLQVLFEHETRPVFFDVGANVGDYSIGLRAAFPGARIIAIEAGRATSQRLVERVSHLGVEVFSIGISNTLGSTTIHHYADDATSQHATIHRDVIVALHGRTDIVAEEIQVTTLDAFCSTHAISHIDFLKIDTEGHELAILQGATSLLSKSMIRAIQFEFNEMNVVARVFLKDFYSILQPFSFYRLDTQRLIPLGAYDARNEIFKFQNIVALSPELTARLHASHSGNST
jgi:FkbM family methyltransferase